MLVRLPRVAVIVFTSGRYDSGAGVRALLRALRPRFPGTGARASR